jgi:hypothetical protein
MVLKNTLVLGISGSHIKKDLQQVGLGVKHGLKVGMGRSFLWVPSSAVNFFIKERPVRFSRRTLFNKVS